MRTCEDGAANEGGYRTGNGAGALQNGMTVYQQQGCLSATGVIDLHHSELTNASMENTRTTDDHHAWSKCKTGSQKKVRPGSTWATVPLVNETSAVRFETSISAPFPAIFYLTKIATRLEEAILSLEVGSFHSGIHRKYQARSILLLVLVLTLDGCNWRYEPDYIPAAWQRERNKYRWRIRLRPKVQ